MIDSNLKTQPTWRYTNVVAGDKIPYPTGWQKKPLILEQVTSTNIGLLLGEQSGGLMAIDFDGTTAWEWFNDNIGCPLPATAMWSSGKTDRCQMAFTVDQQYWEFIRPRKIITKPASAPGAGDGEGIEFRWNGNQSVIPPSRLDDGRQYVWYNLCQVPPIPDAVLAKWIELCLPKKDPLDDMPPVSIDDLTDDDITEVRNILTRLKRKHPVLGYSEWLTVSYGVASHLGTDVAGIVMAEFYPEQQRGEYKKLMKGYSSSKSPTIGSVVFLAGPDTAKQDAMEQMKQKLKQLKGKQNG